MSEAMSRLEKDLLAATVFVYLFSYKSVTDKKTGETMKPLSLRTFTATAFEREGNTYRFMAAAHCVGDNDKMCEEAMLDAVNTPLMIGLEKNSLDTHQGNYTARLVAVGKLSNHEDFAVLEAKITDRELPVIPLSDFDPEMGEEISNIASPLRLGKALFRGYTATPRMSDDTSAKFNGVIDTGKSALFHLPCALGSSGSAIVSEKHNSIVAILLGMIKTSPISEFSFLAFGLPISYFRKFWNKAKAELELVRVLQKALAPPAPAPVPLAPSSAGEKPAE